MHTKLVPMESFNGFILSKTFEFNEYLCLITGINGIGKSRLLKSIAEGKTKVYIDENEILTGEIRNINVNEKNHNSIFSPGTTSTSLSLARNIMTLIDKCENIEDLPEKHHMILEQTGRLAPGIEVNVRQITERACRLFDTKFNILHQKQLELSIYSYNELLSISSNGFFDSNNLSLSQLTINYYQAQDCNYLLEHYEKKYPSIKRIPEKVLDKIIKERSPHIVFSEIIKDLFKNKFSLSEPNITNTIVDYYEPRLLDINGTEIKIDDLSSGERTIFWLATKIFQAYYSTIGEKPTNIKIILMDEPDAYLHPKMIVDFYRCLKVINKTLGIIFIFNSHSPTTVALADFDGIFKLSSTDEKNFSLEPISKDGAISTLLEGITQITINPENRREVYVENAHDANIYELIYRHIKNKSQLDSNIILNFTTSSSKISNNQLKQHIKSIYGDDERADALIQKINGQADCNQVVGTVENLRELGNKTATGLIDWDKENQSNDNGVVVLGEGWCYAIENLIYDPISIFAFIARNRGFNYFCKCEEDSQRSIILSDDHLVQQIFDKVMHDILNRTSKKDIKLNYINGKTYFGDKEYYTTQGHQLEARILDVYNYEMGHLKNGHKKSRKMYWFLKESTMDLLEGKYINVAFEDAFVQLQKS